MKDGTKQLTIHILKLICCFSVFFLLIHSPNIAQHTMLYPTLEKGKYDIGYKTIIDVDYSRTYNLNYPDEPHFGKPSPRPIIINIWYPALLTPKDQAMTYGDYIKIETNNPQWARFKKRIEAYNEKNSWFYMFNSDSITVEQQALFKKHLQQPIDVYKNSTPVNDRFPLVIYHPGLGGTLNDNSVLCEYLASNGFVVITSAFQSTNAEGVNLDGDLERSRKDIDFMLNAIKGESFIDFSKIAAIGHSYGAQAVLGYKTEDYSPVSCVISLDNTFDYAIDGNPEGYETITQLLYKKSENMNAPMLVFAGPVALFKVMDSLVHGDRLYATIQMNHNDYTSLGALAVFQGLQQTNNRDTIWSKYTFINKYCLQFLRFQLLKDSSAGPYLVAKHPYLVEVHSIPAGKKLGKNVPEYTDLSVPPSYNQINKLFKDKNSVLLNKVLQLYPDIVDENFINNAGYGMINKDIDFAIYLFEKNVALHPNSWNVYDSLGDAFYVKRNKELAIKNYKKSLALNPKNENALKMIEKLQ